MSIKKSIVMLVYLGLFVTFLFLQVSQALAKFTVIKSSLTELEILYEPQLINIDTIICPDGSSVFLPVIKGTKITAGKIGSPIILEETGLITVPSDNTFHLTNYEVLSKKIIDGKIAPVRDFDDNNVNIEEKSYNSFSAGNIVTLKYEGISRSRNIASLAVIAAEYNSANNSIEIPEKIYIKITFDKQNLQLNNNLNDDYDPQVTLNHNETSIWRISETTFSNNISKQKNTNKILSSGTTNWIRIAVKENGLYRIDKSMLSSLGFSINKDDVTTIKIFGNGGKPLSETPTDLLKNQMNEQAIIVNSSSDGNFDNLIFYGAAPKGFAYSNGSFNNYFNPYTTQNYYLMTWGGDAGKRAVANDPPTGTVINNPINYTERYFYREELTNAYLGGSGRFWFGGSYFPRVFSPVMLNNLNRNGNILYRFNFAQRSSTSDGTGNFICYENNNKILNMSIYPNTGDYIDANKAQNEISVQANLVADNNQSVIKIDYQNPNNPSATPYFDWYEIHYPRSFVPVDNEITFFSDLGMGGITEFDISGYTGGNDIYGFEIDNPANPVLLKNSSTTGGMFVFRDSLSSTTPKEYYITTKIKTPTLEKAIMTGDYRHNFANSDIIVITNPDLLTSAQEYTDYRNSKGKLSASIFRTDEIYNEFNGGTPDPTAIRDFIGFCYYNWTHKPKYVVLWGDGHYDYRNITTSQKNFILPYESLDNSDTFNSTISFTSDDYFVKVAGNDDLIDLALGRIPVDDNETGDLFVQKLKYYENSSSISNWRTNITLLADDSFKTYNDSGDGSTHVNYSEGLGRNYIPKDFLQTKVYLVQYPTVLVPGARRKPGVTQDWVSTTNTLGNVMVNWIGHGNPNVLAHEIIYDRITTTPLFINMDKLFFFLVAGCEFLRYDMTESTCGSEDLLFSKAGGAISVIAATRVVYGGDNAYLNNDFYKHVFERNAKTGNYVTVGDALFNTKQEYYDSNSEKFNLLGDPAMSLLLPNYIIKFDTINGVHINDSTSMVMKGLSNMNITGSIHDPLTDSLVNDYNGTVIITMLDSDDSLTVYDDYDGTADNILKFGGALNRSSYSVKNGQFFANFILPKDISFSGNKGRLFAYSYSNDSLRFAKGSFNNYVIDGITSVANPDTKGPDINLYLNSPNFKTGDIVNPNPLLVVDLQDASGINTTGIGIGHKIEAWLDDNPNSIDLTSKFSTSLTNSKAGTASQILFGLTPGVHTVKVRAWDVFNNYSLAFTNFKILPIGDGAAVYDLLNYPNPFSENTTIYFKYNLDAPSTVKIEIYNSIGELVKSTVLNVSSSFEVSYVWDGRDNFENSLPSGAYFCNVSIWNSSMSGTQKSGVIVYLP